MDRNAPELRSGSSFGDRNAVPVHFFVAFRCFFRLPEPHSYSMLLILFLLTDPDYQNSILVTHD
jgi:hypothetical protein